MTTHQREQIRLSLLRYCNAADTYGLAADLLLQFLRQEGFRRLDGPQLASELAYLTDKGLLREVPKIISPENRLWRITATGRDFFALQKP